MMPLRPNGRVRLPLALAACVVGLASGCGPPLPAPESPHQAAARVFAVAERLEKAQKTKQAFAAYRQVADQFPDSPEGKKAAARIRRFQNQATTKRR